MNLTPQGQKNYNALRDRIEQGGTYTIGESWELDSYIGDINEKYLSNVGKNQTGGCEMSESQEVKRDVPDVQTDACEACGSVEFTEYGNLNGVWRRCVCGFVTGVNRGRE